MSTIIYSGPTCAYCGTVMAKKIDTTGYYCLSCGGQITKGSQSPRAVKASAPAKPAISPAEIRERQRQFDALSLRLDSARQSAQETGARLQELKERERKAEKLLSLTEGVQGFASERQRASDVLEECAERRAQLEPRAQGGAALIKQLEAELGRIDTSLFKRAAEIEQLAHELSPKEV